MPAESTPDRALERAVAAVDAVIESLVEMKPAGLRRAPGRLSEAVAALTGILQRTIAAGEKPAIASAARALRKRLESAAALLAGAQRCCAAPRDEADFNGYTAEGETERVHSPGTLLLEI
ncbi:MAG TPA: hypothetical protein VFA04_19820 [Bryobacteraceae bacterium]|jgi:hypothetical protein|nr:hypothetical protein [Bryobacteraceae bacterium]